MKAYKVTVNGNVYEITLEVVDKEDIKTQAPVAPAVSAPAGGRELKAPMTGTILKVNFTNGQSVKAGDDIFILEAMKMENEVKAPCDGVVSGITVSAGSSVETGTVLCVIA